MFVSEYWFAWRPVVAQDGGRRRIAWLETVFRNRHPRGAWRYYTTN